MAHSHHHQNHIPLERKLIWYILGLLSGYTIGQLTSDYSQSGERIFGSVQNKNGDGDTARGGKTSLGLDHRLAKVSHPLSMEGFVWPSHRLGIPDRQATERPFSTPALSLLDFMSVLGTIEGLAPHGLFLNVGAADGCLANKRECDEANQLLPLHPSVKAIMTENSDVRLRNKEFMDQIDFHGVLFEPGDTGLLRQNYVTENFRVVSTSLDYFNAVKLFEELQIPKDKLDILKYDTDAMDCDVIDAILTAGYQPTIIMAEFNIVYPPPLRFNFMASPHGTFRWGVNAPTYQQLGDQCSLSYLSALMSSHGYTLIQVDWWDAFFVRDSLVHAITGGSPLYDDLSWYLHGYVTNAPSDEARVEFLRKTAYGPSVDGLSERWVQELVKGSRSGSAMPLDTQQHITMRTEFWWLAAKVGYVPIEDASLSSRDKRRVCHDGCTPQPFTLL